MADQIPYGIRVRRELYDAAPSSLVRGTPGCYRDIDDLDAAGIVAADESVVVTAVYAADEAGSHAGEPAPPLHAVVYVWEGEAVIYWLTSDGARDKRGTLAMRQVLARAQRIADLANDLATGPPIPMDGPLDRGVDGG